MNISPQRRLKVLLLFLLMGFCWGCSKSYPNSLVKIFGTRNSQLVTVDKAFNKSSFNDTVIIWCLSHSASEGKRLREELKLQKSDVADLKYAKLDLTMLDSKDVDAYTQVYRGEVNEFDIYWMFNASDEKSALIGYQY